VSLYDNPSQQTREDSMQIPSSAVRVGGSVAAGVGIIILAPVVASLLGRALRPVTKSVIKGGVIAAESVKGAAAKIRASAAEAVESLEDIAAEAKAELAESAPAPTPKKRPAPKKKKAAAKSKAAA
jgi:hypothetical protein